MFQKSRLPDSSTDSASGREKSYSQTKEICLSKIPVVWALYPSHVKTLFFLSPALINGLDFRVEKYLMSFGGNYGKEV